MIVTEKEAAEKWCPHARVVLAYVKSNEASAGHNRIYCDDRGNVAAALTPNSFCIGSRCMAWRWSNDEPIDDDRGYCGLAGKP